MSDKKFQSGIFGSYRNKRKIDQREEFRKEMERQERIEDDKEMCYQLQDALPNIKQQILQAVAQRDLVSFAYNYFRSIFCEHAEEMDLETLTLGCSLLEKECDWGVSPKISVQDIYVLPMDYNMDYRLGSYTVRDLIGCALCKIRGTHDCTNDFFENHCRYE